MTAYSVHGEDREGDLHLLRHLQTKRDAELHMQRLEGDRHWRRLWIEATPRKIGRDRPKKLPEFPWRVIWVGGFTYVEDARGQKIAVLLGPNNVREFVATKLTELR